MATGDFDLYYPSTMWDSVVGGMQTNQRNWYDPLLRSIYVTQAVYARYATTQFNLYDKRAPTMTITSLLPPQVNINSIDVRQLWMASSFIDSFARTLNFNHYGIKLALHAYDDLITYWQQDNVAGLRRIINAAVGPMITELQDKLARNAFLSGGYAVYGSAGTATSFNGIGTGDKITTPLIDSIHLGMAERGVPYASNPEGIMGNIVCVTSPGVMHDLRQEMATTGNDNAFIETQKYNAAQRLLNMEVGTYHNVRFIQTPRAILYNCGPIAHQVAVKAAINAGDGAPDPATTPVDGALYTGQPNVVHYIQLDTFTAGDFAVNDIVTLHVARTAAHGVTNGVDYTDGKLYNRRVVAVDNSNHRLSFDRPIMEDFTTDLGSTVYGYVTKGRHIHTAIFIGGADGIVQGVSVPMSVKMPPPVDDFQALYRVSADGYFGYKVFEPQVFEAIFLAGTNRIKGPPYVS